MRRFSSTRWWIAAGVGVACAIAAALIAISLAGSGDGEQGPATSFATGSLRVLAGIPQNDQVLGSPSAPVRLVEYADVQCPFCAHFAAATLPPLVREYVRDGKLRIEFRPIAFIGPDSPTGVRAVVAAGLQDLAGLPVAVLGVAGYVAILACVLLPGEAAATAAAALSAAGLVFAAYLIVIQVAVLDALCQWCLTSDGILFLLTLATVWRARRQLAGRSSLS